MAVLETQPRPVIQLQTALNRKLAAIQRQRVAEQGMIRIGGRVITAVATRPGAEVFEVETQEIGFFLLDAETQRVIVFAGDPATIEREHRGFRDLLFEMQIRDAAEHALRNPSVLFRLRAITESGHSARADFDPVVARFFRTFKTRWVLVFGDRQAGAERERQAHGVARREHRSEGSLLFDSRFFLHAVSSVAQRRVHARSMHGFVAARRPARALLHAHRVVRTADEQLAALHALEVTLETEIGIARREHLGIHRAMRAVTRRATFVHRFVFEHERTTLHRMTFQTVFVLRLQRRAAAQMCRAFVRRMTFNATHLAFHHRMAMRQIEFAAHVGVAREANGFDSARVGRGYGRSHFVRYGPTHREAVRRLGFAAGFGVNAARAVTRFATSVHGIRSAHQQHGVIRGLKRFINLLVALFAFLRADVFRARNIGQFHDHAFDRATGHRREG